MPLKWILLMSWRNAWRTPRRSVLALITIAMGLFVLIFLRGVQDGYMAERVEAVVSLGSGHAVVIPGSEGAAFLDEASEVSKRLKRLPGVVGVSTRLRFEAYLEGPRGAGGAEIIAFVPEDESQVTALTARLGGGKGLPPALPKDASPIALGAGLAARLGARPGDHVSLLAKSPAGPPSADRYLVGALLRAGVPALDDHLALMRLDDARALLGAEGAASQVALRLNDAAVLPVLQREWDREGVKATRMLTWADQAPEVRQTLDMLKVAERLRGFVVFGLVGLGITNMLSLSVLERRREFGVLVAAGVAPGWLLLAVLLESLAMGLVGVILGCAIGAGITGGVLGRTGIDLRIFGADLSAVFGIEPVLYPTVTLSNLAIACGWVLVVSTLVALPAAWRVLRVDPAEAIRET